MTASELAGMHSAEGQRLQKIENHAEAIGEFRAALAHEPDSAVILNYLGVSVRFEKRYDEALPIFQRAAELSRRHPVVLVNLGLSLTDFDRLDEAMACYLEAAGLGDRHALPMETMKARALAEPIASDPDANVGVHTLLCHRDLYCYLYAVKTLARFSGLPYAFHVYDDGTLTVADRDVLAEQIAGIRIVSASADDLGWLDAYPTCRAFHEKNPFGKRFFGVIRHATTERIIMLDSDVLFLKRPEEIVRWAAAAGDTVTIFNPDPYPESTWLDEADYVDLGVRNVGHFNAGLICTHRCVLDLDLAEQILGRLPLQKRACHRWIMEQTLLGALASRHSYRVLPTTYSFINNVNLMQARPDISAVTTRHYSFPRGLMFAEGVSHLIRSGIL